MWGGLTQRSDMTVTAETGAAFDAGQLSKPAIAALGGTTAGITLGALKKKENLSTGGRRPLPRQAEPAMRPEFVRPDGSIV